MNKPIILALILTTLFQLFSQKFGSLWEYAEKAGLLKCVYCDEERIEEARKINENDECVYCSQEGYEKSKEINKNGDNVYIDN